MAETQSPPEYTFQNTHFLVYAFTETILIVQHQTC